MDAPSHQPKSKKDKKTKSVKLKYDHILLLLLLLLFHFFLHPDSRLVLSDDAHFLQRLMYELVVTPGSGSQRRVQTHLTQDKLGFPA